MEDESQYEDSTQNTEYNDDEDELADVGCARSRLYSRKPRRSALKRVQKRLDLPKTAFEQFSRISQLDNTYHHVLSTPRSIVSIILDNHCNSLLVSSINLYS